MIRSVKMIGNVHKYSAIRLYDSLLVTTSNHVALDVELVCVVDVTVSAKRQLHAVIVRADPLDSAIQLDDESKYNVLVRKPELGVVRIYLGRLLRQRNVKVPEWLV